MSKYFEETKMELEKEKIYYTEFENNVLGVGFNREEKPRLVFKFQFDESSDDEDKENKDGEKYMHLGVVLQEINVKKVYSQALVLCNTLNSQYRWVKFYIDQDYEINVDVDAILTQGTAGAQSVELMFRMMSIIESAEPRIQQLLEGTSFADRPVTDTSKLN